MRATLVLRVFEHRFSFMLCVCMYVQAHGVVFVVVPGSEANRVHVTNTDEIPSHVCVCVTVHVCACVL